MYFIDLPISFWGYTLNTVAFIINKVPSKSITITPFEIWKKKRTNIKQLKIWGYPAYVKRIEGHKLSARSHKYILNKYIYVGYPTESMGYYFYYPTEQKVFVSRHTIFLKKEFISGRIIELKVQDQQTTRQ